MTIFSPRDLKHLNKNSPPAKIESGYTHVLMIAVPKEGYKCPEISNRDKETAHILRKMAIRASDITKNISDIMFQSDVAQHTCGYLGNECGRIRNLSNDLYKISTEIGGK